MVGAVDIGGTKIAVALVDGEGRVVRRAQGPTAPERGFDPTLERIAAMLRECARAEGVAIRGVGVGSTGPVDPESGLYGWVDHLPGWQGANLRTALERALGVPVVVENDADAAALGEAARGAGRGRRRFLYVTISTGIGGGLVLDGALYRGVDGSHPEIGHHVIEASGPDCYCGSRGCWELLASGPAMAAWAAASAPSGLFAPGELTAKEVCARAERGEEWARRAVEREAWYLGVGLANLVMMFCPDMIALGGGVMESAHLFLDRARSVVRASCALVPSKKAEIALATLGGDAGLVGAARAFELRPLAERGVDG